MTESADAPVTAPAGEIREAVLLFDHAGRLVATSADELDATGPALRDLDELAARFVHTDGTPVSLAYRARQVALPRSGGPRVLLVSEPLAAAPGSDGGGTAVSIMPFRDENDPETILRALGSVLAHELRTPLTTVYAGSQLLATREVSPEVRADAAGAVVGEADRLARVVEDLIVLVRWGIDPPPEPEPILLEPVLAAVVRRATRAAGAASPIGAPRSTIELHVPPRLPPVVGSQAHLEHALRNVIGHAAANAVGRPVVVDARRVGRVVEIRVRDDGPSLDDATAKVAFDLFARTGRPGGDPSGANLALVVARRLVERMGGTIQAHASTDGGDVTVRLPIFR